jgi:hypothetical protein
MCWRAKAIPAHHEVTRAVRLMKNSFFKKWQKLDRAVLNRGNEGPARQWTSQKEYSGDLEAGNWNWTSELTHRKYPPLQG